MSRVSGAGDQLDSGSTRYVFRVIDGLTDSLSQSPAPFSNELGAQKKPSGAEALGNNRAGVECRSWVTTWIQISIKTLQPTKGLLGRC